MSKIRLSPSGPIIGDAGAGFRLRLVNGKATGGDQNIPTTGAVLGQVLGTTPLLLHLDAPQPNCQYRAMVRCDVSNPATTVGTVTLTIDTSVDGGATWTPECSNVHFISGGPNANNGARQVSLDLVLTGAAALGVTSSPATPSLFVRARIACTSTGGTPMLMILNSDDSTNGAGTIYLELEETTAN